MARTECTKGGWTTLADLGAATQVFTPGQGVWYSTDAVQPTDYSDGIPLPNNASVVLSSGLPIHIWAPDDGRPGVVAVIHQRI